MTQEQQRIRPKPQQYNFKPLEQVMRSWVKRNEQT